MKNFLRFSLIAVLIALIVVQNARETDGKLKKKIMMKKLKKMLPLLLAMKPKKKLIILPLPIPMGMMNKLGSSLQGLGGGGGMHHQMPIMSAPMSAPMDSWMMMNAMDCSSDFYGMGNAYQSSSYNEGSQGGWGGSSGGVMSGGNDGWGGSSGGQGGGYGYGGGGQKGGRVQSGWA